MSEGVSEGGREGGMDGWVEGGREGVTPLEASFSGFRVQGSGFRV